LIRWTFVRGRISPESEILVVAALCPETDRLELRVPSLVGFELADSDSTFRMFADQYIKGYLAWRPAQAVELGLHEYDGKVPDFSKASLAAERLRLKKSLEALEKINPAELSPDCVYDRDILKTAIQKDLFEFDDDASYTHNPMTYADSVSVNSFIQRDYPSLEQRVKAIVAVEQSAPSMFEDARANLDQSLPRPFIVTAITVAEGSADFLEKDLVAALKDLPSGELKMKFDTANQRAITELKSYAAWLKSERLPKSDERFALGREKYQRMITDGELIELAPDQVLSESARLLALNAAIRKAIQTSAIRLSKKLVSCFVCVCGLSSGNRSAEPF
jgi:uncharacterized protein (DUF885 family)